MYTISNGKRSMILDSTNNPGERQDDFGPPLPANWLHRKPPFPNDPELLDEIGLYIQPEKAFPYVRLLPLGNFQERRIQRHRTPNTFQFQSQKTRRLKILTERKLACKVCPKVFGTESGLNYHSQLTGHGQVQTQKNSTLHQKTENTSNSTPMSPEEKLFTTCLFCDYQATSQDDLFIHKKCHQGAIAFVCHNCDNGFSTQEKLNCHTQSKICASQDPKGQPLKYICVFSAFCSHKFPQRYQLYDHYEKMHLAFVAEAIEMSKTCSVCDFLSGSPEMLTSHMSTHKVKVEITIKEEAEENYSTFQPTSRPEMQLLTPKTENVTFHAEHDGIPGDAITGNQSSELVIPKLKKPVIPPKRPRPVDPTKPKILKKPPTKSVDLPKIRRKYKKHEINPENKYHCLFCRKAYPNNGQLSNHLRTLHSIEAVQNEKNSCTICGYLTGRAAALTMHMKLHCPGKPNMCRFCDYAFSQPQFLTLHFQKRRCPYLKYLTPEELSHILEPPSKSSSTISVAMEMSQNPNQPAPPFVPTEPLNLNGWKCSICDQTFPCRAIARTHEQTHGTDFPCEECPGGVAFNSIHRLRKHQRFVHPVPLMRKVSTAKKLNCSLCDQPFMHRRSLAKHEANHGEGFPCLICPASFKTERYYHAHLRRAKEHPEILKSIRAQGRTGDPSNSGSCKEDNGHDEEGKNFETNPQGSETAIKSKSGVSESSSPRAAGIKPGPKGKNIKCPVCDQVFPTTRRMLKHRVHHGHGEWFPCVVCPASFTSLQSLQHHMFSAKNHDKIIRDMRNAKANANAGNPPDQSNYRKIQPRLQLQVKIICPICSVVFETVPEFNDHLKGHGLANKPTHFTADSSSPGLWTPILNVVNVNNTPQNAINIINTPRDLLSNTGTSGSAPTFETFHIQNTAIPVPTLSYSSPDLVKTAEDSRNCVIKSEVVNVDSDYSGAEPVEEYGFSNAEDPLSGLDNIDLRFSGEDGTRNDVSNTVFKMEF